jgi:hypothetical protein
MTREEILKAALAHANGKNPLELANEMIAFLKADEGDTSSKEEERKKQAIEQIKQAEKRYKRVTEIMGSFTHDEKDEFYIPPERVPAHPFLPFAAPKINSTAGPEGDTHTDRQKRKSPTTPENRPEKHRLKWSDDDKLKAAALLEKAKTEQDILDAAASIGRTRDGIMEQAYKGHLPIDHTRLEKKLFPMWKKVPRKEEANNG